MNKIKKLWLDSFSDSSYWLIIVLSSKTQKPTRAKFNLMFYLWHFIQAERRDKSYPPGQLWSCFTAVYFQWWKDFSRSFMSLLETQNKGWKQTWAAETCYLLTFHQVSVFSLTPGLVKPKAPDGDTKHRSQLFLLWVWWFSRKGPKDSWCLCRRPTQFWSTMSS